MLAFIKFLLLIYISGTFYNEEFLVNARSLELLQNYGTFADSENRLIYLPHLKSPVKKDNDYLKEDTSYCFRMTWLGEKYDNSTFPEVMNKTCSEFFDKKDSQLCIDPMAVTFTGKRPDFQYVLNNYAKEATCKLSKDQVCAKYTVYFNGIESHVVRYCTRIEVEPEGTLQSGCLTEKKGSYSYEICACISGKGIHEVCNKADYFFKNHLITLIITQITYVIITKVFS